MDKNLSEVEIRKLKKKSDEANTLNRALKLNSRSRVSLTDEITSYKSDGLGLIDEIPKYSHYLCFSVSVRTKKFALKQLDGYSPEQEEVFQKIKSL